MCDIIILKNMKKNKGLAVNYVKGFTLIELLVVIAIIGILASVVLMSLSATKKKGIDNSIKTGLNQARTEADVFYNYNSTYSGVCSVANDAASPFGINNMIKKTAEANGLTSAVNIAGAGGTYEVRCNDSATGWAAQVPLKDSSSFYCVDYTRKGIVTSTSIGNSAAFCQ